MAVAARADAAALAALAALAAVTGAAVKNEKSSQLLSVTTISVFHRRSTLLWHIYFWILCMYVCM